MGWSARSQEVIVPAQQEGEEIAFTVDYPHPERPGETIDIVTLDWVHIYEALASGRDVELGPGRFYVNQSIRVFQYTGSLKGAGRALFEETGDQQHPIWRNPDRSTIIEAGRAPVEGQLLGDVPGERGAEFGRVPMPFGFDAGFILSFTNAVESVSVSDLTLLSRQESPCDEYSSFYGEECTFLWGTLVFNSFPDFDKRPNKPETRPYEVSVNNVGIRGIDEDSPGSRAGRNTAYGIVTMGRLEADWSPGRAMYANVSDSVVENLGNDGMECFANLGGTVEFEDNTIRNTSTGVWLVDDVDVSAEVRNNTTVDVQIPFNLGWGLSNVTIVEEDNSWPCVTCEGP